MGMFTTNHCLGGSKSRLSNTRPNIIFFLSDDTGWGEIEAMGNPVIKTPNLNRLYSEGVRFTNFHVAPSCAPTRSEFMTGNHAFRNGVTHTLSPRRNMTLKAITIADVLKKAGYKTAMFGKWHLGMVGDYRPENRGFDEALLVKGDRPKAHWDPSMERNGEAEEHKGYRTDIFFDEAMKWIESNKDQPFFCYIPTHNSHGPMDVDKKWSDPYEGKGLFEEKFRGAEYYGEIANQDYNLGRLLKHVEDLELTDNTIIIYGTDNGHAMSGAPGAGHNDDGTLKKGGLYNAGMRGGKGQAWRGSTCVPLIFRWPGHIAENTAVDRVCGSIDFFPTIADICGAEFSHNIEGKSLVPLIENADADFPDRMIVVHRSRWPNGKADEYKYNMFAVQSDRYRMVNKNELYDHINDPGETQNIAGQHPEKVKEMLAYFDCWWEEVRPLMVNEQAAIDKASKSK